MVSGTVSLFCSKCFSPFPHGTCSLSVSREYLALPDGPGGFTQDSSCPALLRIPPRSTRLRVRSFHALRPRFPARSARRDSCVYAVLQPPRRRDAAGFGLFPGRSPLLGESRLFSFPAGTKMFQFPALASAPNGADVAPSGRRVVPFGNPRITGYLLLPADFRSLSRPSSPPRAKASAMRPFLLFTFRRADALGGGARVFYVFRLSLSQHVIDRASQPRDGVENNGFEPLTPLLAKQVL